MILTHSDWLGLEPIFYLKNGCTSSDVHFLGNQNLELSAAGIRLYLEYGFSVFGQSIFKDGYFLTPGESLIINNQSVNVNSTSDPTLNFDDYLNENEILEKLTQNIYYQVKNTDQLIVVPLSGGYDSRLILLALRGIPRDRIWTFTYGTSYPQKKSCEILIAQEMARRENVRWNQIELGDFLKFKDAWFEVMGPHVHSHGMYHMDFYNQIRKFLGNQNAIVISGLVGDLWSGKISVGSIKNTNDLDNLNYNHGIRFKPDDLGKPNDEYMEIKKEYFLRKEEMLLDPRLRIVELVRTKMMLLRFLKSIPNNFNFDTYLPFGDQEIAMSMLNLPIDRRQNRIWQKELFKKNQLDIDTNFANCYSNNSSEFQGILASNSTNFDASSLTGIIGKNIIKITTGNLSPSPVEKIFLLSKLGGVRKSALANLYGVFSPTMKKHRYQSLLDPLVRVNSRNN